MLGFEAHWAKAVRHIDATFSEEFSLEPCVAVGSGARPDGNARPTVDPGRPVAGFRATFRDLGSKQNAQGRSMSDNTSRAFAADQPYLRVTTPGEGFTRPQVNDRIIRLGTGERFRVTSVIDHPRGVLQVALSRSGA